MGKRIEFTAEQKADIVAMYKQGMSTKDILGRHNINSPSTIYTVLKEMGVEWEKAGPRAKFKKCSCGNNKNSLDAKYCFMCGRLLLSEEEQAIDKLFMARAKIIRYVPETQRAEVDKDITDAINILKIKLNIK